MVLGDLQKDEKKSFEVSQGNIRQNSHHSAEKDPSKMAQKAMGNYIASKQPAAGDDSDDVESIQVEEEDEEGQASKDRESDDSSDKESQKSGKSDASSSLGS